MSGKTQAKLLRKDVTVERKKGRTWDSKQLINELELGQLTHCKLLPYRSLTLMPWKMNGFGQN
jgi:hypothetical protein